MAQVIRAPASATAGELAQLQQLAGNRAVTELFAASQSSGFLSGLRQTIQTKLNIGNIEDPYEREADRVADSVMRMPVSSAQVAQRKPEAGSGGTPQTQAAAQGPGIGGSFQQLDGAAGGGSQLPDSTREFMEARFGADFGDVRVHADSESAQLNGAMQAQAFTHGRDIYFSPGRYKPDTQDGRKLLAHELTHVVQQTGASKVQRHGPQLGERDAGVETGAPGNQVSLKKLKMVLDFVRLKRKKDYGSIVRTLMKKMHIGRQDRERGHWWGEIGDMHGDFDEMRWESKESYGWWPPQEFGNPARRDIGNVNGVLQRLGHPRRDPLHLFKVGKREMFHPVMEVDENKEYDEVRYKMTEEIRKFSKGFETRWWPNRGWGDNNLDFLEQMSRKFKWKYKDAEAWLRDPEEIEDMQAHGDIRDSDRRDDLENWDIRI
ncbi:MAG: DUF4157 domain-containing protein [Anaerolineales bacterium]